MKNEVIISIGVAISVCLLIVGALFMNKVYSDNREQTIFKDYRVNVTEESENEIAKQDNEYYQIDFEGYNSELIEYSIEFLCENTSTIPDEYIQSTIDYFYSNDLISITGIAQEDNKVFIDFIVNNISVNGIIMDSNTYGVYHEE